MRLEEMPTLEGEIERLKQQLAELEDDEQKAVERCVIAEQRLAECQADNKRLRDALKSAGHYAVYGDKFHAREVIEQALAMPSDSTALDTMLKQAELNGRREALLEALTELQDNMTPGNSCYGEAYYDAQCSLCDDLRRMAKELE